jgi:CDP-diacylglycerol--glycerol-3-phosphate 3-phosphatidyltransferase
MQTPIDAVRSLVKAGFGQIARALNFLSAGKITPNSVSVFGLLAHLPIAWLIADGQLVLAGFLLIVFGLMDTLDGALARLQGTSSDKGMFLDSVSDRAKEVMIYIGITYFLVSGPEPTLAVWAVAACGISVLISYLNAWGEVVTANLPKLHVKNKAFRNGLMTFDIRMFVLVVGLLFNALGPAVVTIAVLGVLTALQRFANVYRRL